MDGSAIVGILLGAVFAALGYVGKLVVESIGEWRRRREQRLARLHQLQALLRATRAAFLVQRTQADRLANRLRSKYSDELPDRQGYERLITHFHDRFDADDEELHSIVRAYTKHALLPLNQAILTWLREDIDHRTTRGKSGSHAQLAAHLNQLDAHLLLWLAKYEAWIPDRPDHALVYLADEQKHGVGFPTGLDEVLEAVIAQYG